MTDNAFVSPFVQGLITLTKSEGYDSLIALYDAQEKIILKELAAAPDDRTLTIIQGKYKLLLKLRHLPEVTIDRYMNDRKSQG